MTQTPIRTETKTTEVVPAPAPAPVAENNAPAPEPVPAPRELPKTASDLPLLGLAGLLALGGAAGVHLMRR